MFEVDCRAQDRNAKALQKPYDRKVSGVSLVFSRGPRWKKNAERLSNSLSGNYPTTSRQWLLQKLNLVVLHHLMTHIISLECSQKLCATHRLFQILHKSIKFWCPFKILIHIFSHHLAEYGISWVFLQLQMLHLLEAMSCSVPPQGAFEEGSAIVGSPIVESKPS